MADVDTKNIDRSKTAPFLIRVFVKQYPGHRTSQFDGPEVPVQDEYHVYTWMDATLQELLLGLRALSSVSPLLQQGNTTPIVAELHHPLAKYSFRSIFPDPSAGGRFQSKEIGDVYARDLSDSAIFEQPFPPAAPTAMDEDSAPKTTEEEEPTNRRGEPDVEAMDTTETGPETAAAAAANGKDRPPHGGRESRTLASMRFRRGDYLAVSVRLPKNAAPPPPAPLNAGDGPGSLSIRGSAAGRGVGFGRGPDPGPARQIPWVTSPTMANAGPGDRDVRRGSWRGGGGPPTGPSRGGFGGRDGPGDRRDVPPPRGDDRDRRGGRGGRRGWGPSRGGRSRSGSARRRSRSRDRSMASSPSPRRDKSLSRSRSRSPRRD